LPNGFSDDRHYLVYRYDAGQLSLSLDLLVDQGDPGEDHKGSPVRGLLVADDLYVANENAVSVHSLDGARLATVTL
jgi:hypothetical protein